MLEAISFSKKMYDSGIKQSLAIECMYVLMNLHFEILGSPLY